MSADPLLQPFQLKHLILRNRIIITSHEPAYAEDGMPKARYRAYHVERAKAGIAMTMTAGSAAVSRDSPPVFNNILAYKDEVVPWLRDLADACHSHGAAAHRAFPKKVEDWDIARIVKDYADAAERMQAAGLDGIELQAYGHLIDQFWSPITNDLEGPYGGSLDARLKFTFDVLTAVRERVGTEFIVGVRFTADEAMEGGISKAEGLEISQRLRASGMIDFLNVVRGHIDTDAGLTDLIPVQGKDHRRPRRANPALCGRQLLPRPHLSGRLGVLPAQCGERPGTRHAARHTARRRVSQGRRDRWGPPAARYASRSRARVARR